MPDFTFADPVDTSIGTITITQSMTAISPGNGGTLTISSGTNVPSKGYALIDGELIQYASISVTTLTLASSGARGAGNPATTAAAHSSGTAIYFDVIPSQQVRELRAKFDATTGHAHTGAAGDGAAITDASLSTSDITTNDVSITKHGFAPKAPNDTTKFLRGDATWNVPNHTALSNIGTNTHAQIDSELSTYARGATAPANAIYVDSTGNIGAGVTSPATNTKLHVVGTIRIEQNDTSAHLSFFDVGSFNFKGSLAVPAYDINQFVLTAGTGKKLGLRAADAGASHLVIDTVGNVGLGMTGPSYQLQLSTDSAAKPSTNTWTIVSDTRTKDPARQRPYTNGLAWIIALPVPIYFTYNGMADTPEGEESVGWNAQDLSPFAPGMVRVVKGKLTPKRERKIGKDGKETYVPVSQETRGAIPETSLFGVNTHELQFAIVNALREVSARLGALEAGRG